MSYFVVVVEMSYFAQNDETFICMEVFFLKKRVNYGLIVMSLFHFMLPRAFPFSNITSYLRSEGHDVYLLSLSMGKLYQSIVLFRTCFNHTSNRLTSTL